MCNARSVQAIPPPRRLVDRSLAGPLAITALAGLGVIQTCRLAGLSGDQPAWLLASLLFLLGTLATAILIRHHYPHQRLGACNVITLLRGALVCALLAPLASGAAAGWGVAAVGGLALALDGVDGWLARRSGLASAFGARFDMEVDAALALVLSLHILSGTVVGAEVLLLGTIRYGFVAAGRFLPWLTGPLRPRFRRKLVCVIQLATLVLLQLPELSADQAIWLARAAAVALVWSFAVDIAWLWRHRP